MTPEEKMAAAARDIAAARTVSMVDAFAVLSRQMNDAETSMRRLLLSMEPSMRTLRRRRDPFSWRRVATEYARLV